MCYFPSIHSELPILQAFPGYPKQRTMEASEDRYIALGIKGSVKVGTWLSDVER